MHLEPPDPLELFLTAFGSALLARDHEALDVLLAPWIPVSAAIDVVRDQGEPKPDGFEVLAWESEYEEVSDRLPPQVDSANFIAWSELHFYRAVAGGGDGLFMAEIATASIAGGTYVGFFELS